MRLIYIVILFIFGGSPAYTAEPTDRLYACVDDQVRLYEVGEAGAHEVWRWTASEAKDLPRRYRNALLTKIDECKPAREGEAILVTSSTGGVVLLDRATGRVRFRANAPMAHSADLLPNDRVAVALSIHEQGDRLEIYDVRRSERPLFYLNLPSGHGVVWDADRQRLFALSHDYIQAFELVDWSSRRPRLQEIQCWVLPGQRDGHDLSLDPETNTYFVTTDDGAWRFDPENGRFDPVNGLNPTNRVKAVTLRGDRMAWQQAEESWWAHGFAVAARDGSRSLRVETPGLHLYKVRWLP